MTKEMKRNYLTYMHVVIMFALMFIIGGLPAFGKITPMGMKVLGVFIGTLYGWIFIDLLWVSIISMVALGFTGYGAIAGIFMEALGSAIGLQVLITCIFAGALTKIGAVDVISNWMLTRNFLRKSPWLLIIAIFATATIGTLMGAGIALIFMLWGLVLNAADTCGYDRKDPFVGYLLTFIVILAFAGSGALPFRGTGLMFLSFYTPVAGEMAYEKFILFNCVYIILLMAIVLLAGRYMFKFDVSRFRLSDEEVKRIKNIKATKPQKIGCCVMVAFLVCMMAPVFFPKTWGVIQLLSKLGLVGVTSIALMLMALVRNDDGTPSMSLNESHSAVPWEVIWLIWATVPLANAMESSDSGIMATIVEVATPVLSGMSPTLFMIVASVFLGLLTQVTHNIVLGAMFIPFLTKVFMGMGGNYALMFMLVFLSLNCAYATPAASMQAGLVHANENIGRRAYKWGIYTLIWTWAIMFIVGIPLGNLLW